MGCRVRRKALNLGGELTVDNVGACVFVVNIQLL